MNTYYAVLHGSTIWIHNADTGAPHFTLPVSDGYTSHLVNGNILTVCYNNGTVEVYDMDRRARIR